MDTLTLSFPPAVKLTDRLFYQLCQANRDLRLERTADGELIVMPPTGGETSRRNLDIAFQLQSWNRQANLGVAFDSSGGFRLPNGATRSPDASWVSRERWAALTSAQREQLPPLCPDFVVELCSPSDTLATVRSKMQEYMVNGARLGWLINPKSQQVEVYQPDQAVGVIQSPAFLSAKELLPGFVLDLSQILAS